MIMPLQPIHVLRGDIPLKLTKVKGFSLVFTAGLQTAFFIANLAWAITMTSTALSSKKKKKKKCFVNATSIHSKTKPRTKNSTNKTGFKEKETVFHLYYLFALQEQSHFQSLWVMFGIHTDTEHISVLILNKFSNESLIHFTCGKLSSLDL